MWIKTTSFTRTTRRRWRRQHRCLAKGPKRRLHDIVRIDVFADAPDGLAFHQGNGTVVASIDNRNFTSCCRSAGLLNVSTPPVPALRCVTLVSTASRELAAPLWKNVCGKAKSDSSEGGTKPSAPRGGAALARTSLNAVGSNVPTLRSCPINCPLEIKPAPGGGVKSMRLRVRSEEHTSELQSLAYLVCRLLLEKKKKKKIHIANE